MKGISEAKLDKILQAGMMLTIYIVIFSSKGRNGRESGI